MKKKKLLIFSLVIIIMIIVIFWGIKNNFSSKKSYSTESQKTINVNKLKEIYQKEYSKTLDEFLKSDKFNNLYLNEYLQIDYIETDNFLDKVNTYLNKGYNAKEINNIFKLSSKNQEILLNIQKQDDFSDYIGIKNFDINKLHRYKDYLEKTNRDLQTVVTYVNIGLDNKFYSYTTLVSNPDSITALVNKYHFLDENYVPKDLVPLFDNKDASMVKEASIAYEKLIKKALEEGITIESTTAYRSYAFQNMLYTNYVLRDGISKSDTYSARPGSSEHQLGLAVDLNDPNVEGKRLDDKDYNWLLNNSYKYGFIVRYTKSGIPITGYIEEPWHLRYLGNIATSVYESGLTYDEYYDLYIMEY